MERADAARENGGGGRTLGAAITNHRVLGPAEAGIMVVVGLAILGIVTVGMLWPLAVVLPLCVLGAWIAVSLLVRAFVLRREGAKGAARPADSDSNRDAP